MHQDWAFYKHANNRYVDVLVHLDDTRHENGEIRFLAGSHKHGRARAHREGRRGQRLHAAPAVREVSSWKTRSPCPPSAATSSCFNIFTIHGIVHQRDRPDAPAGAHRLQAPRQRADRRPEQRPAELDGLGKAPQDRGTQIPSRPSDTWCSSRVGSSEFHHGYRHPTTFPVHRANHTFAIPFFGFRDSVVQYALCLKPHRKRWPPRRRFWRSRLTSTSSSSTRT